MKYYIGPIVALILSFPLLVPTFFIYPNLLNSIYVFAIMCLIFLTTGILYDLSLILFKKKLVAFKKFALYSGFFWLISLVPIKFIHNNLLSLLLSYSCIDVTITYLAVYALSGFIFGIMFSIVYRYIVAFAYA